MQNINSITAVSANNSMRGVTITSNLTGNNNNNNKLIITIKNTMNGGTFSLYCNENDICKIRCYSKYGCENFHLYCYGLCAIGCNSINFNCPIIEYGINESNVEYLPSLAPTFEPTIPTNEPTFNPSKNPTFNPSFDPSHYPTLIPSVLPTSIPTFNPSMVPSEYPTTIPSRNPHLIPIFYQPRILVLIQVKYQH